MLAAIHLPLLRNQAQTAFEQEKVLTFTLYLQPAMVDKLFKLFMLLMEIL